MRTVSAYMVFGQGVALLMLFLLQREPLILAVALPLLAIGWILATVQGVWPLIANTVGAAILTGVAVAVFAYRYVWLDGLPAALLMLAAAALPIIFTVRLSRKLVRIWPGEQLVLSNPFLGGLRTFDGPRRLLVAPFSRLLARIPLGRQEFSLTVANINTRPRAGPMQPISQNIRIIELEIWLQLGPSAFRRLFSMPNKNALYAAAASAVGKPLPAAMLDLRFWPELLRELTHLFLPPALRDAVLRSHLDPYEISAQRDALAAQVLAALVEQFGPLDVQVHALHIPRVEFDETEAALRSREELLKMQSVAEGMRYVADAVSDALERVAEVARRNDLPVPVELLANLIDGMLLGQETSFTRIRATGAPHDQTLHRAVQPPPTAGPSAWPPAPPATKKAA